MARDGLPSTPSQAPPSLPCPERTTEPRVRFDSRGRKRHDTDLCTRPSCPQRRGSGTTRPLPGRKTEHFSGAPFGQKHVSTGGAAKKARAHGQTAIKTILGVLPFGCPASLRDRPPGAEVGLKKAICQNGLREVCKVIPAKFSKGSQTQWMKGSDNHVTFHAL